jgi:CheY-like chemotaxis protein
MAEAANDDTDLTGRRVLVLEDEWFIADEVADALTSLGAVVVGPAPDLAGARELAGRETFDTAVLDINLHGELVFEFADELVARGVAIVFATGYAHAFLPPRFKNTPHFEKPLALHQVVDAVIEAQASKPGPTG